MTNFSSALCLFSLGEKLAVPLTQWNVFFCSTLRSTTKIFKLFCSCSQLQGCRDKQARDPVLKGETLQRALFQSIFFSYNRQLLECLEVYHLQMLSLYYKPWPQIWWGIFWPFGWFNKYLWWEKANVCCQMLIRSTGHWTERECKVAEQRQGLMGNPKREITFTQSYLSKKSTQVIWYHQ